MRKDLLKDIKKIVIKVGSSSLTYDTGLLNLTRIEKLVRQIANLHNAGYEVVLVTSGAIAAGMGKLNLNERPKTIPDKQACAAVGQVVLIHLYQRIFAEYGKNIGQLLLTKDDISNRDRFLNARNLCYSLISNGSIPVVNENDAVAVDEIKVGDNDTLSALVVSLIDADLLIILSDIDGLYDKNPKTNKDAKLIHEVKKIDDKIRESAQGAGSKFGTGGMATKISAAEIATNYGSNMIIALGENPAIIEDIVSGKEIGTLFLKSEKAVCAKKHWISFGSKKEGAIIIDDGAKKALLKHKSLLPIGVKDIKGDFSAGKTVSIKDINNNEIAVGISNFSSSEIQQIKGYQSEKIKDILKDADYNVIVHINNMYLTQED